MFYADKKLIFIIVNNVILLHHATDDEASKMREIIAIIDCHVVRRIECMNNFDVLSEMKLNACNQSDVVSETNSLKNSDEND